MQVNLYEDIARFGHIATHLRLSGEGKWALRDGPVMIPEFDNPKMDMMPALQLFGGGGARSASMRCRRLPAWKVSISTITCSPFSSG